MASGSSQVPCLSPVNAYRSLTTNEGTGKRSLVFKATASLIEGQLVRIPCGQCTACRIAKAKEWAARCMNEASLYDENSFITLTFDDDHLPEDYSVHIRTFQLFMYRLRQSIKPAVCRVFYCGEYGPKTLRPHYHALLFNYDFHDRVLYSINRGNRLYTSAQLTKLWPYGLSTVGNLTHQSAGYVARYNMKKIYGSRAEDHYTRIHPVTGRLCKVTPEFLRMSNRPGIGATWLDRFKTDVFPSDFIIIDGQKFSVPRYYFNRLSEDERELLRRERKMLAVAHREDNTRERLKVRLAVLDAKVTQLKREI